MMAPIEEGETTLCIGGFSFSSTQEDVRQLADSYGAVAAIYGPFRSKKKADLIAFVVFKQRRAMENMIAELNGKMISGCSSTTALVGPRLWLKKHVRRCKLDGDGGPVAASQPQGQQRPMNAVEGQPQPQEQQRPMNAVEGQPQPQEQQRPMNAVEGQPQPQEQQRPINAVEGQPQPQEQQRPMNAVVGQAQPQEQQRPINAVVGQLQPQGQQRPINAVEGQQPQPTVDPLNCQRLRSETGGSRQVDHDELNYQQRRRLSDRIPANRLQQQQQQQQQQVHHCSSQARLHHQRQLSPPLSDSSRDLSDDAMQLPRLTSDPATAAPIADAQPYSVAAASRKSIAKAPFYSVASALPHSAAGATSRAGIDALRAEIAELREQTRRFNARLQTRSEFGSRPQPRGGDLREPRQCEDDRPQTRSEFGSRPQPRGGDLREPRQREDDRPQTRSECGSQQQQQQQQRRGGDVRELHQRGDDQWPTRTECESRPRLRDGDWRESRRCDDNSSIWLSDGPRDLRELRQYYHEGDRVHRSSDGPIGNHRRDLLRRLSEAESAMETLTRRQKRLVHQLRDANVIDGAVRRLNIT